MFSRIQTRKWSRSGQTVSVHFVVGEKSLGQQIEKALGRKARKVAGFFVFDFKTRKFKDVLEKLDVKRFDVPMDFFGELPGYIRRESPAPFWDYYIRQDAIGSELDQIPSLNYMIAE